MKRRRLLQSTATIAAMAALGTLPALAARLPPRVEVFKSPQCGCCGGWIEHMRAAGFDVKVTEVGNTAATRQRLGIPAHLGSCHTAMVEGYALEGHVPAVQVKQLLASRLRVTGLAVPGMPAGSPGMEGGGRQDAYDVLLVDVTGRTRVYASYPKS